MKSLEQLRDLADQVRRAAESLDSLRRKRDDAIREVRRSSEHTVSEIAAAAGVSEATVKTVIRGVR